MYKHILVATDGSELARKGLEHGLRLARQLGAKITVLTVSAPLHKEAAHAAKLAGVTNVTSHYDQQITDQMQERFAYIKKRAREHEISVDLTQEVDASPAEAIVRQAKVKGCDLIVMASHGRRGVQRMLLGSQTAEVLATTAIPVLVIR